MEGSMLPGFLVQLRKYVFAGSGAAMFMALAVASSTSYADETDGRQVLELTAAQRAHVLGEMRAMLIGTQAMLAALNAEDMATFARQARALGMGMGHKAENHLHDVLPPAFMKLGMSVHQDFDRIASDAETLKDAKHSLQQLSSTMNTCNICHEVYQIQVVRLDVKP